MKKVLLSTDLEGDQSGIAEVAIQHARNLQAMLIILHVEPASSSGLVPLLDDARAGGPLSERHEALVRAVVIPPSIPHRHVIVAGHPAPEIVAYATQEGVDLIVLPTSGRRGLRRLIRGSVAEEVVRFAPCPVYTFRRPAPNPASAPASAQLADPSEPEGRLVVQRTAPAAGGDGDRTKVHEDLTLCLSGEVTGLRLWFQRQLAAALTIARDPWVVSTLTHGFLQSGSSTPESEEIDRLRSYMDVVSRGWGFSDFLVLDPRGLVVASRHDDLIGRSLPPVRYDFVASALAGEGTVSKPTTTDLPMLGPRDVTQTVRPSIFAIAPILDGTTVRGALGFRLRGEELNRLVATTSPYKTIESYVFDRGGTMLSPSRFEADLSRLGLPLERDNAGLLYLRDPGGNLLRGHRPNIGPEGLPLTRMAADAVLGNAGVDLDGYRDYRGVMVVGTWQWLDEQNMGVAIEVDRAEAFPQ